MGLVTTIATAFVARTATFDKNVMRSRKGMAAFNATVAKTAATMRNMAAGFIAAVGIRGIARYINRTNDAIDATAKLSDRLNIATEDLIGLRHAAGIMGSSSEAMDKSLEMLVRRLGEVRQGTGEAKRALEELGLDVNKLVDLSPAEAFRQIADEINNMDKQADKAAAAYQLFGRQGVKLLNTMSLGSDGLKEMQTEVERLGTTFTRLDAARVEEANDSIMRMKESLTGVGQTLSIKLAPTIEAVSTKLTDMVVGVRNVDKSVLRSIGSAVKFSAKLTAILVIVPRVVKGIAAITVALKSLAVGAAITQAVAGPAFWVKLAAGVGVAIVSVKKIEQLFGQFSDKVKDFTGVAIDSGGLDTRGFSTKIAAAEAELIKLQDLAEKTAGSELTFGGFAQSFQRSGQATIAVSKYAEQIENAKIKIQDLNTAWEKARKLAFNAERYEEAAKAVDKFNAKLELSIELFGKTANEKTIAKLEKMGETLTGLEKDNFDALIVKTRQFVDELDQIHAASDAVDAANTKFERLKTTIDSLVATLRPAEVFERFTTMLQEALDKGLISMDEFVKLGNEKFDKLFVIDKVKAFADSIRESLKTPMDMLSDFGKDLREAGKLELLTVREIGMAFEKRRMELFPQLAADEGGSFQRGQSQQVRTAFVDVQALAMLSRDPVVREQEETNDELRRQTDILRQMAGREVF